MLCVHSIVTTCVTDRRERGRSKTRRRSKVESFSHSPETLTSVGLGAKGAWSATRDQKVFTGPLSFPARTRRQLQVVIDVCALLLRKLEGKSRGTAHRGRHVDRSTSQVLVPPVQTLDCAKRRRNWARPQAQERRKKSIEEGE